MAYPQQYYYPQQMQPQMQQIQTPSNGFVSVRSELEARNYPVAYGNSVTFKDENAPYVYTKTMGFSQLETPKFEKYKLVKEEIEEAAAPTNNYVDKSEIDAIWKEIDSIKKSLAVKKKKEVVEDDDSE